MDIQEIRVLVVEDDEEDFLLTKHYLSSISTSKYSIEWVNNYNDAVCKIAEKEHDVYLIDYNLGTTTGTEIVRQAVNSGIQKPFIMLTGMDDFSVDNDALKAGAIDFLVKQKINKDLLERAIRYAIKQKHIEAELTVANNTKNKMFSIISHDLRAPIASLTNSLSVIIESTDDEITPEMKNSILKELSKSTKNTLNLLDNLLSWAKSQIGAIVVKPEPINLAEIITDLVHLFERSRKQKSIEIIQDINDALYVYADRDGVEMVLRNLLSNAIKFTPELGRIEIGAERKEGDIMITVSDTGLGMDNETKLSVLQSDVFITNTGTNKESGSGLGLKIAKEFVEKMNGCIWVESAIDKGSTFFITLPKYSS